MADILREFRILGVHPVIPTGDEPETTADLFLIEVEIEPANAEVDWGEVTQPIVGMDQSNWQVPYDERPVDSRSGRWAFFLHFVQPDVALTTPVGPRTLPAATPMPVHLAAIKCELP